MEEDQAQTTMKERKHISVCICTFKRPELLAKLLHELAQQTTEDLFSYSVVVVDNDRLKTGKSTVDSFCANHEIEVKYLVEERPSIALARNKTVENATGDYVAFIDDDEFPTTEWLLHLFRTCEDRRVAGVLGPVLPYFDQEVPKWIIEAKLFERPRHPTGFVLDWALTRTGNVLLKRSLFHGESEPFRPQCVEGSDQEFFKRMGNAGNTFVWCDQAIVYEVVPPARWKRSFLLRRALFRGVFSLRNHGFPPKLIARSLIATPAFAAALPFTLALGQAQFMNNLFKLSYHVGRILAVLGFDPVDRPYVSE